MRRKRGITRETKKNIKRLREFVVRKNAVTILNISEAQSPCFSSGVSRVLGCQMQIEKVYHLLLSRIFAIRRRGEGKTRSTQSVSLSFERRAKAIAGHGVSLNSCGYYDARGPTSLEAGAYHG